MSESKPFRELWLSRHDWPSLLADISRQGYTTRQLTMLMHGDAPANYHRVLVATEPGNSVLGFTWDDVDMLRGVAKTAYLMMENRPPGCWSGDVARADELAADLADRIAALLPPREPKAFTVPKAKHRIYTIHCTTEKAMEYRPGEFYEEDFFGDGPRRMQCVSVVFDPTVVASHAHEVTFHVLPPREL